MEPHRKEMLKELLDTVEVLPEAELREVTDFADFLHQKRSSRRSVRGSADALLEHAGSFRFESGELDRLLTDIDHLRQLDLESDA